MVADYARISMIDVANMSYIEYLVLRKDAYIYRLSQSEKGCEYLRNAYLNEQTEPDREGLRKLMNQLGQS